MAVEVSNRASVSAMEVEEGEEERELNNNVMSQLTDLEGTPLGPPMYLPQNAGPKELQQMVNKLLNNEEKLPYAFYILDQELVVQLGSYLQKHKVSVEKVLTIIYQPQAVFRIRPVSRCSATIAVGTHIKARRLNNLSRRSSCIKTTKPYALSLGGSGDTTVRLWDLNTQTPMFTCTGHKNWVLCIAWSPDGKHLVSGSKAGELQCWDPQTGKPSGGPLIGHKKWITGLSWEPLHLKAPCRRFVSSSKDGDARIWDITTRKCVICLSGHTLAVTCVKWGGDGVIYTGGDLGRWWDEVVEGGEWLGDGGEEGKEWDGEGSGWRWGLYVVGRTLGCLLMGEGEVSWVKEVRIKMGGKRTRYHLFPFSQDCTIKVWETSQGKLIRELKGHGQWVNSLALSTEYVLRTGAFDHTGKQYSSPEEMKKVALERYNKMKGSAPERLVSGSDDFTMFLWEPAVNKHPKTRMTGHQQLVNHVYFSPDGKWVASASFDKSVKLWNGITGKFVAAFRGHVGPVYQISWSADSRLLLSGSKDSTLKVWDIRTQKLKQDLPGHADEVFAVDWSPDGEKVASGGRDRVLKLWMG
ncbi:WD-40 repeat family protein [Actinidia rufa]|uniref:WD-40 repeat family protein n=1 Tax=Actinidia rufa TaxID=165716 RepID=A0A7J0F0J1_9ERIC|nr:WD-40 repeat family protein [Actinidia rufa]